MFLSLDFVYMPAPDIARVIDYYVSVLGAELIWKVRDGESVVARVQISESGPALLLANHLAGLPIFIYRVDDLDEAVAMLTSRGWTIDSGPFDIPHGPCVTFRDPSGQRLAIYELVRPEIDDRFNGRLDP